MKRTLASEIRQCVRCREVDVAAIPRAAGPVPFMRHGYARRHVLRNDHTQPAFPASIPDESILAVGDATRCRVLRRELDVWLPFLRFQTWLVR